MGGKCQVPHHVGVEVDLSIYSPRTLIPPRHADRVLCLPLAMLDQCMPFYLCSFLRFKEGHGNIAVRADSASGCVKNGRDGCIKFRKYDSSCCRMTGERTCWEPLRRSSAARAHGLNQHRDESEKQTDGYQGGVANAIVTCNVNLPIRSCVCEAV